MRVALCATLALSLLASAACGGPELEFADWIEPVPREGVPIHEYAGLPYDERTEMIEVVDDLVLGDPLNPEEVFFQPTYVDSDASGNIFVLDTGDPRIQVFDRDGNYLRTMGREGQGPGEFARPSYLVVTDDHVVLRADTRRLSTWTLEGEHVQDRQLTDSLLSWMGFDQGFVARHYIREEAPSPAEMPAAIVSYSRYDALGERVAPLIDIQEPEPTVLTIPGGGWMSTTSGPIPDWMVLSGTAPDGTFFVTTSAEYQLHAYGPRPWSLRVAWPRQPVTGEHIDTVKERYATAEGMMSQVDLSGVDWAERHPAIRGLEVDGHGHIYVYPFHPERHRPFARGEEPPDIPRMVDVYSRDGELLFNGLIDLGGWTSARGDFVYTTRSNEITEEAEVVRLRLIEPF